MRIGYENEAWREEMKQRGRRYYWKCVAGKVAEFIGWAFVGVALYAILAVLVVV